MAEKLEDFNLPTSVVSRIVKESLPDGVNVSKEARAALSKAASVFVLYATSCANSNAIQSNRKTLTGQDVMTALHEMEFDSFIEPLEESLNAFREEKAKKASGKSKKSKESADSKDHADEEVLEVEEIHDILLDS